MGENFTFQQDNATIHNSKLTKACYREKNIHVMEWSACSLTSIKTIQNLVTSMSSRTFEVIKNSGSNTKYKMSVKTKYLLYFFVNNVNEANSIFSTN